MQLKRQTHTAKPKPKPSVRAAHVYVCMSLCRDVVRFLPRDAQAR